VGNLFLKTMVKIAGFSIQPTKDNIPFFKHNFIVWDRVIKDSNGITLAQLGRRKNDKNK
jgi:hypothetical protein